jgi:cytochrome c
MKKIGIIALLALSIVACNNNADTKKETKEGAEKSNESYTPNLSEADYQEGLLLVSKSDCFTCHKISDRIVGPSYSEVAERYAGANSDTIASLAQKIIKGGSGVWGEQLMNPHPQLSQADAEMMVKYILLLKK